MPNIRQQREELEKLLVSDRGVKAVDTKGRVYNDDVDETRTCFQRDIDRVTHCKSFRRLKHKTQVFLQPEGDHYRTRLTHTLEVSRIARTISRALMLNEDLTEAIALGHDLGHTPFGHAGERALDEIYTGGFKHYEQSLRVVDKIEKKGRGLNLCYETRMGILHHTYGTPNDTNEATVVRLSDRIAYINHDADDAVRAKLFTEDELPDIVKERIGDRHSTRINAIIKDLIENSSKGEIKMSSYMQEAVDDFHKFMFEHVYRNPIAKGEETKVKDILEVLFKYYVKNPEVLPNHFLAIADEEGIERAALDYVSGMTDDYALHCFSDVYIPAKWQVI